jgi:DNA ligase-associated metallophosphoesterase
MEIEIRKHRFMLLPQKALFWKNKNTLLISDLHLGKVTHFRKAGIAIPEQALYRNFYILDELIQKYLPKRIIMLGDLFHSDINYEWELFSRWRIHHRNLELILVQGNHDILPVRRLHELGILADECWKESEFLFCHHPPEEESDDLFTFCGHVHPVFIVRTKTGYGTRIPCFVFDHNRAVLPSFGVFTGGYSVDFENGRKIFLVANDEIVEI